MSHRDDRARTTVGFGRVLIGKKSVAYRVECRDNKRKYIKLGNLAEKVQPNTDEFLVEALEMDKTFRATFLSGVPVQITLDESKLK